MIDKLFMIRNGSLGTDFEAKVLLTSVGILLCLYDWFDRKRKDYFWVFIVSAVIGFLAEWCIQAMGNRVMPVNYLWGQAIPVWESALLRATCEGSAFIVACLFFGDRILEKKARKRWVVYLFLMAGLIISASLIQPFSHKNIAGAVASRREITSGAVVFVLLTIMFFDSIWYRKSSQKVRLRAAAFLWVLTFLTVCWTVAEYAANKRWIEIGTAAGLQHAPRIVEFMTFVWDVLPETVLIYLPFLALPYIFGLIKEDIA